MQGFGSPEQIDQVSCVGIASSIQHTLSPFAAQTGIFPPNTDQGFQCLGRRAILPLPPAMDHIRTIASLLTDVLHGPRHAPTLCGGYALHKTINQLAQTRMPRFSPRHTLPPGRNRYRTTGQRLFLNVGSSFKYNIKLLIFMEKLATFLE